MIISYGFTLNGQCVVSLGVVAARFRRVVRGEDELLLTLLETDLSNQLWNTGYQLTLREVGVDTSTDAGWSDVLFVGRVVEVTDHPLDQQVTYRVVTAWEDFSSVVYETDSDGAVDGYARTHVTLGRDGDTPVSISDEVNNAVDYAEAQLGNTVFKASVSSGIPDIVPPADEQVDMTCEEVVNKMLRYVRDAIVFWDHTQTPARLNITRVASLTTHSLDMATTAFNQLQITEHGNKTIRGAKVYVERANLLNGEISDVSLESQTDGSTTGPRVVTHTIELEGQKVEKEFNTLTSRYWSSATVFDILEELRPDLFNSEDYNYTNFSYDIPSSYLVTPYVLVDGDYKDWMADYPSPVNYKDVAVYVEYTQTRKDNANITGSFEGNLSIPMIGPSTYVDGGEQTFERTLSTIAQEEIGELASLISGAVNVGEYSGSVGVDLDREPVLYPSSPYPLQTSVAGRLASVMYLPGRKLNLTNGRPDWATMNAVITDVDVDLNQSTINYTLGDVDRQGIGDVASLLLANSNRNKPARTI